MITFFSKWINHFFLNKGLIKDDDLDICIYGFEMIITTIIGFIITISIGLILNTFISSLIYYFIFVFS